MKDAASAAAMSDPTLNRWFRRRWVEPPDLSPCAQAVKVPAFDDDLALNGLALLEEWRQRDRAQVQP